MYDAWITPRLIFTLHKTKDKTAYPIQDESLNHLDIGSPRTTTIQNILEVLAENSLTLVYSATGSHSRIKSFLKKAPVEAAITMLCCYRREPWPKALLTCKATPTTT